MCTYRPTSSKMQTEVTENQMFTLKIGEIPENVQCFCAQDNQHE